MKSRAAIIVLAAGKGARFKSLQHKLGLPLGGSTVLAATLANALATNLPVTVVTSEPLAEMFSGHVATRDIVVLPSTPATSNTGLGMGYPLAAGVAACSEASGWLVLPADMALIHASTLKAVARALDGHPIAYPQHAGRRGHPVGFGAELYSELIRLNSDDAARRLLSRYPAQVVEVADAGVLGVDGVAEGERGRSSATAPSPLPTPVPR